MILEPGQEIERYVVEGVLGEGGMAAVYRVRHRTLDAEYALKVLTIPNRRVRDRMIQEGRIQARIRHANVVSVLDVLEIGGMTGLLMEMVRGPSLEAFLEAHPPDLDEALALFGGILAGVDAAHAIGLVHRDLKPDNVLLAVADDGVWPKILDFGVAKGNDETTLRATRPGATMGTPAYMAPEQMRDASAVGPAADVWSLGAILYELVCGRKLFDGDGALEIMNAVASGTWPPPEELRPDLPATVVAAIHGALKRDPAERLADCKALAAVLGGVERVESVSEALPSHLPPSSVAAVAARELALKTATTRSYPSEGRTWGTPMAPPAREERPRRGAAPWIVGGAALFALTGAAALIGALWVAARGLAAPDPAPEPAFVAPVEPVVEAPPEPEPEPEPIEAAPEEATPEEATPEDAAPAPVKRASRPPPMAPSAGAEEETREEAEAAEATDKAKKKERPARVRLEGEARKLLLKDGSAYYPAGQKVPPGTYRLLAYFDDNVPVDSGSVTLAPGASIVVSCDAGRPCAVR